MSGHTKGPWTVTPDADTTGVYTIREHRQAEEEIERQADNETDDTKANELYEKQADLRVANRRVIEAAPELLAALEELAEYCDAYVVEWDALGQERMTNARAAIARAKGGA